MVQEGLRERPADPLIFIASKITWDYYLGFLFLLGITTWDDYLGWLSTLDGFLLGITTWDGFLLGITFHLGLLGNIPCYCFGTDSGPFE